MKRVIFLFSMIALALSSNAQGIRGTVLSEEGEILSYASVYVRNIGDGVPTNEEGRFEFALPPGIYDVIFQYLGYESLIETIIVEDGWTEFTARLKPQTYTLETVEVEAGQEDPALTIMRKAIAKAKYHRLQVQQYSMTVYLKGTGQLTDAPFFLKKTLEEEGLKLNEAYTSESVSRITFTQPDKVEEKVISIRTNGDNQATSPAPYIETSFYQEKINDIISPLSRAAFQYYRFKYEGSFFDQDVLVSKIKVTPRSRGEQVFEGYIYIIEDLWAIHSLNLQTSLLGFQIQATQQYAPVEENVWMPLTHTYKFGGKFFGFEGNFNYLASTRDYELTLNEDLVEVPDIIDEKIEEVPEEIKKKDSEKSVFQKLADEEPKTRKEYRKLMNEYEKEMLKEEKEQNENVTSERYYSVDSLAKKRELSYWDSIRPVPLTDKEIAGYKRDDSLAVVEAAKMSDVDSVAKKARTKYRPLDFMNGASYSLGGGKSIGFRQNWTKFSFNTVEGFKMGLGLYYRKYERIKLADSVNSIRKSFNIEPELRYGFSSNQFYGKVNIRWSQTEAISGLTRGIEGGRYIYQFNGGDPINEQVNAFYSLLFRQNYMKLYDQSFVRAYWAHRVNSGFTYRVNLTYADRNQLFNNSNYSFYNKPERVYTPNQPENVETSDMSFQDHQALILRGSIDWRPGITYNIYNGVKYPNTSRSPLIKFAYERAFGGISDMAASYDHVSLGIEHAFDFGVSGDLDFKITGGTFLSNDQVYFQDFQHFGGNRTIFSNFGPASNYRFMDYYKYSTQTSYFSSIVHYQFRKFLFTQLPMLRFSGLRENIFFNYLKTENSPHYWEVGYSLDNLFRIFRVEFGAGFENGNYLRGGARFGIATFITVSSGDN
ncbi:DUF5686 and carboxypeptidase regulatory-like domain-containing protein [Algoriphagus sediminis]|uniref:DUF5686 and carboxypeptidase regulatory-like domain-containing protein n=1 Tax=Algoriphagus sediminis TaxID=3057113 RepID=A0ABT7YGB7_9BACT|nr:DUF5686 and carboxypeptidase regulatory-like domain-containing protein [Algoriphagus sediminis]MDN3205380.1 DUF5686 and carboxypeptidase regulatory-like domain-containing protein [Algoriphagus sediminis]